MTAPSAAPSPDTPGAPSVGDRVEVRDSRWMVAAVDASAKDTVVELNSLSDDGFGETLKVVWELEPGRRLMPPSGLPEIVPGGFDRPEQSAAFLDAMLWSALVRLDTRELQAPFRSGADVKTFQLEPLRRSLATPRVNQLLADDVGLGKTVEAGLVAKELILRHLAQRVMIVCPAGLTTKWKDEMFRLFGLDFTIVNSQTYTDLRRERGSGANPFDVYRYTIVSLPWLRGPKAERLLFGELLRGADERSKPFFDLLILDEAHHIAPAAPKQRYAVDSQQTKTIRALAAHFTHRLFLSATPHNGYSESFTALLEILDPSRFARGVTPARAVQDEAVIRRLKSSIVNLDGSPEFRTREVRELRLHYSDDELEVHRRFSEFTAARRARPVQGRRGRAAADLVTLLLKKRLLSSPKAFAETYASYAGTDRDDPVGFDLDPYEFFDGAAVLDDEDLLVYEDDALRRTTGRESRLDPAERAALDAVSDWALDHSAVPDTKARRLLAFLDEVCKPGGMWTNERVVVFTEYRDTLNWLRDLLNSQGFGGDRVAMLHGGMDVDDREQIRLAFQADPAAHPLRILLATDAAGEGIDLQNHCNLLVNYDIPFNPNKLEQRAGRIDRYGQRRNPQVFNFVPAPDAPETDFKGEIEFLARVAHKVSQVETDLGSVNPVLAGALQRRLAGDTSVSDVEALTAQAVAKTKAKRGGEVPAAVDVAAQIARLDDEFNESMDRLHLHPDRIRKAVDIALDLAHQNVRLEPVADPESNAVLYRVPDLTGEWVRGLEGLLTPFVPEGHEPYRRLITFDPLVARGRDDIVLAHLSHPLVDMSARLLRAAARTDRIDLHRVTAVVGPDDLKDLFVAAYSRYALTGGDSELLHQEVIAVGGWLDARTGRFSRENLGNTTKILDAALDQGIEAGQGAKLRITEHAKEIHRGLSDALRWRKEDLDAQMARRSERRAETERDRIRANYDQFRASLEDAIRVRDADEDELAGLIELEREQAKQDEQHWHDRLEQLGAERDRELDRITARYAGPVGHATPLAIVCIVPERDNR